MICLAFFLAVLNFYPGCAALHHADFTGCFLGKIKYVAPAVWPTIIHHYFNFFAITEVGYFQFCAEGKRTMCSGMGRVTETLTAGCSFSIKLCRIIGGPARLKNFWCTGI